LPYMKVSLPQSLTGDSADPKIRALHQQLREIDRKLETGEFDIPPEGQRSPSPTPVYDKNGVRLNTREIRMREKLQDQKQRKYFSATICFEPHS
jgi:splicing factor 1